MTAQVRGTERAACKADVHLLEPDTSGFTRTLLPGSPIGEDVRPGEKESYHTCGRARACLGLVLHFLDVLVMPTPLR